MKPYYEYADKVLNGSIVVGEYIKLACERFLNDLQREDLEFREEKVDLAIQFISTLTHYKGRIQVLDDIPAVILKYQESREKRL